MEQATVTYEGGRARRVVLTNAKFRCTKCKKWKAASAFGFRKMEDGTVRNQAQCSSCR